ncbi:MAG: SpoIIE family protein phosphatase [Chlorobi bacterium]|nr:SpoIIE family protein phosphatase [Chlorobiota bacterium]
MQIYALIKPFNTKKLINTFICTGIQKSDTDKLKAQKTFHNTIGGLMILGGLVFGSVCLISGIAIASYISYIYVIIAVCNFIYYHFSGNFKVASFSQILFTILVPFSFYLAYGDLIPSGMIILWIMLPIVSSIAVSGLKDTVRWFLFVAVSFIISLKVGDYFNSLTIQVNYQIIKVFFDFNAIILSGILIGIIIYFIKTRDVAIDELEKLTKSLEKIVAKRTKELSEKVKALIETEEELRQNNEELISANDNIARQKKEIERIHGDLTDSLNLTKIIQEALLTRKDIIDSLLKEYFILYKPKDQVSGDFYYFNKVRNNLIFTVADCTGHGISGGFLTVLGISNLHSIIKKNEITSPSAALRILRDRFINFGLEMHIGLDIALCFIDVEKNILQYSGANNPLFIIRDHQLLEYRANKNPVSFYFVDEKFQNYSIQLQNNDIIYLFSDGYKDQFGGKLNRKFSFRRFKELLISIHNEPMSMQKEILLNTLNDWQGEQEQIDDITLLSIKWKM